MEGHSGYLEEQPNEQEEHSQLTPTPFCGTRQTSVKVFPAAEQLRQGIEFQGSGEPIDQRAPEEEKSRRERSQQEILDPSLR